MHLAVGHVWPGAPLDRLGGLRIAAPCQGDLIRLGLCRVLCLVEQVDDLGVVAAFVLSSEHRQAGEHAGQHRELRHRLGTIDEWLKAVLECAYAELAGI